MRRGGFLILAIGLILGLAGGLYYSWAITPVEYVDTAPTSLREDFLSDYLALIASAYMASGDLARANARIHILELPNPANTLSQQAQNRLAAGRPETEARALALLAAVLGERPTPLSTTPTPEDLQTSRTTTPTRTPQPSSTPLPTRTPTATPGAPFELVLQEKICMAELPEALLQVQVLDASGRGVPGVEILVVWDAGQDRFYTGLKPELGSGYADFTMQVEVIYSLQLTDTASPVIGLSAETCIDESGDFFPGSWSLNFQQPDIP